MKRSFVAVASLALVVAFAAPAWSDATGGKLGEPYAKGSPAEKLALLAVAQVDKTVAYADVSKAVDEVVMAEVEKGKTSEERLKVLGQLRKDSGELVKKANEARKA